MVLSSNSVKPRVNLHDLFKEKNASYLMKNFCLHPGTLLYMDSITHIRYGLKSVFNSNIKNLENRFY